MRANVSLDNEFDTQSLSVYFFIASTNKVDNNIIIAMRFKTLIIKFLVFILSTPFLFENRRLTLTSNVPYENYISLIIILSIVFTHISKKYHVIRKCHKKYYALITFYAKHYIND